MCFLFYKYKLFELVKCNPTMYVVINAVLVTFIKLQLFDTLTNKTAMFMFVSLSSVD